MWPIFVTQAFYLSFVLNFYFTLWLRTFTWNVRPPILAVHQHFRVFVSHLGICSGSRLAIVGGVPYLIPVPNMSKVTQTSRMNILQHCYNFIYTVIMLVIRCQQFLKNRKQCIAVDWKEFYWNTYCIVKGRLLLTSVQNPVTLALK